MKINKVRPTDHPYLQQLAEIPKPPQELYYFGVLPKHRVPTVAIIGTRKPTAYGREVTTQLAKELAQKGTVIVSGLALGVDAIAHRATTEVNGVAIAVLGNALPDIRPATNRQVARDILLAGGAIISEHSADDNYVTGKWSFLERNRLVAGLADAVLITEASASSGTLHTAARALEQGKEVFVVPGNITSPMSVGCNQLIKQGATPVTCADDILSVINPVSIHSQAVLPLGANQLETDIIRLIKSGIRNGDELQASLGVNASDLSVALTMLEVNGAIRSLGANQWSLR